MNLKEAMTDKNVVAIWQQKRTGKYTAIVQTRFGLFEYRLDYDGMFAWGATADLPDYIMRMIADDYKDGSVNFVKTPQTCYHVWHICYCDKCNGRVWSHSQGDWDSHLRYVDNDKIFTFPSNEDTPNLPQAAVNEPSQHGVQIGSLGVPDKIIVVPAPEKQGEMF